MVCLKLWKAKYVGKKNSYVYFCFFHSRVLNNRKQIEGEQKKNTFKEMWHVNLSLLGLEFFHPGGLMLQKTAFNLLARSDRMIWQDCPANKAAQMNAEQCTRWSDLNSTFSTAFVTRRSPTSLQTALQDEPFYPLSSRNTSKGICGLTII